MIVISIVACDLCKYLIVLFGLCFDNPHINSFAAPAYKQYCLYHDNGQIDHFFLIYRVVTVRYGNFIHQVNCLNYVSIP
jgi:hypothetical protein